ncbi:MAG TPA: hypothetical protein VF162_06530 [Streptosporangiaceae bacterium]
MQIDVRPVARLRGPSPLDITGVLGPLFEALSSTSADLTRLKVVCDWIQYRASFAEPVRCRPVLADRPAGEDSDQGGSDPGAEPSHPAAPAVSALELALDLRRCAGVDLATSVKQALAEHTVLGGQGRMYLEPWVPASRSCIWRFNALYWQALASWEQVTGREYEQALPGGISDARNAEAVRELIGELLAVWDSLDARSALPDQLYVVELGVGNGSQARTWLDAFVDLDRVHGRDYYRRLHYLMGDYSGHVLERAWQQVAHHGEHVSALVLDASRPQRTLGFLKDKAFCVYISNMYDNLPTDELASIGGRPYLVEARAYLRDDDAARIARRLRLPRARLGTMVDRLLRLGPELLAETAPEQFPDVTRAVALWRDVWTAVYLQERYAPLDGLDAYQVAPTLTGEILRPLLEAAGDVRMHVSNGALASFTQTLPLLHPFGRLICHDLFLTTPQAYHAGFYGPGKYDGSVLNWVNGPLLKLAGNRRGFDVTITPFSGRPDANVRTLVAQVRD